MRQNTKNTNVYIFNEPNNKESALLFDLRFRICRISVLDGNTRGADAVVGEKRTIRINAV